MSRRLPLLVLLLAGCGAGLQQPQPDPGLPDDDDAADDDDSATVDDDDAVDDDDSAAVDDDDAADDDDAVDDDDAAPPEPVRFVAFGDQGTGSPDQHAVAAVIDEVCALQGCDFVLLLGDNHYDIGVDSVNDEQWQTQFEIPYADIDLTFYASLGNHDGGDDFLGGTGINVSQGDNQVDYTLFSTKWMMPDRWYTHTHGDVDFIALDTSSVFFDGLYIPFLTDDFPSIVAAQAAFVDNFIANTASSWKIAYGHHPYLSNGRHGNAGEYEGLPWLDYVNGEMIKNFMDDHICGKVDLYLAGHDHNRQWLTETCQGTAFMVSGAGAKTTDFEGTNPFVWQEDQDPGFVWISIEGDVATVEWWDMHGNLNYSDLLPKPLP